MLYNGRELSQRSTFETRMSRDDRGSRGRAMSRMAVLHCLIGLMLSYGHVTVSAGSATHRHTHETLTETPTVPTRKTMSAIVGQLNSGRP